MRIKQSQKESSVNPIGEKEKSPKTVPILYRFHLIGTFIILKGLKKTSRKECSLIMMLYSHLPLSRSTYFRLTFSAASEYISSSLRRELESFLRRMGYECLNITSNGFCIEIVFPYLLESDEHDKLDLIMKQFIETSCLPCEWKMIPNVSRENEEIIKTIVKRESKG